MATFFFSFQSTLARVWADCWNQRNCFDWNGLNMFSLRIWGFVSWICLVLSVSVWLLTVTSEQANRVWFCWFWHHFIFSFQSTLARVWADCWNRRNCFDWKGLNMFSLRIWGFERICKLNMFSLESTLARVWLTCESVLCQDRKLGKNSKRCC